MEIVYLGLPEEVVEISMNDKVYRNVLHFPKGDVNENINVPAKVQG